MLFGTHGLNIQRQNYQFCIQSAYIKFDGVLSYRETSYAGSTVVLQWARVL